MHDLTLNELLKHILLTVGDGLVAQIPSLLLAMLQLIVTRIASDKDDLAGQVTPNGFI